MEKKMRKNAALLCTGLVSVILLSVPVLAGEDERSWSNTADLSLVVTGGNAQTENLSLSDKYVYKWSKVELSLTAAAVRTETTNRVPTNENGVLQVIEATETMAESYALGSKVRGDLWGGLLWYANAGWDKNELAGVEGRISFGGGLGFTFLDDDTHKLVSEAGFDYTSESLVGGVDQSYGSARGFLGYDRVLSATATLNGELEVLQNLEETEDMRMNFLAGVTASLTDKVALKLSYKMMYDAQPVTQVISAPPAEDVVFEYDKTDTVISTSLVINF